MWLGKDRNNKTKPLGIQWPSKSIYALGVHFSYDQDTLVKENLEAKLHPLENILNLWRTRNLTTIGKINIVKTIALSKLTYIASLIPVSTDFIAKINQIISSFIWNNKPPKIKKNTMIGTLDRGGLNILDFEVISKALKASWVKRICNEEEGNWKLTPLSLLRNVGGSFIFQCNYA